MTPFEAIDRRITITNINYTDTRLTKWIHYIALALAVIWASWWIFFGLASSFVEELNLAGVLVHTTSPGLVFLVSTVIAWRWKAIGGIMLILEGLFLLIAYPVVMHNSFPSSTVVFMLLTMALPPLLAGPLFLISWRKSKTSGIPQNSA
ncbi:hypothetical protein ACFLWD_02785 [Chloroflexota bacterium]